MGEQPQLDRGKIMSIMREVGEGKLDVADIPAEVAQFVKTATGRSVEEMAVAGVQRRKREQGSPKPGSAAPDFELELLSAKGERTSERVRLSDAYDKPVGLVFGSYT